MVGATSSDEFPIDSVISALMAYDTVRYDIFTCAQKLKKMVSLVYSARHRNKN